MPVKAIFKKWFIRIGLTLLLISCAYLAFVGAAVERENRHDKEESERVELIQMKDKLPPHWYYIYKVCKEADGDNACDQDGFSYRWRSFSHTIDEHKNLLGQERLTPEQAQYFIDLFYDGRHSYKSTAAMILFNYTDM